MNFSVRFALKPLQPATIALVASLLFAGCGSGSSGGGAVDGPSRTIQGTRIYDYISDSGTQVIPADMTQYQIAALVPDGSGGYTTIGGTGSSSGAYTIPNVPSGNYLLQNGTVFVETTTGAPDTGYPILGRCDQQLPTQTTSILLSGAGINPFQSQDALQVYSSNTEAYEMWYGSALSIAGNSTSFNQELPWTSYLPESSEGDKVYVTQLATEQAGSYSLQVLKKSAGPLSFTVADGATTPVSIAMSDPPQTGAMHLAFKGSAFKQLESGLNPNASEYGTFVFFDMDPADPSMGQIGNTPDLIAYLNDNGPLTTDVDFGDIAYGNPFPSTWTPFVAIAHYVQITYPVPDSTTGSIPGYPGIFLQTTVLPSAASPIVPLVGPAANPTINGMSFFDDQSGIGTTPTFAWSAPAVGKVTKYGIRIFRLFADSQGQPQAESTVYLYTTGTNATIPPNLLVSGNNYVVELVVESDPGIDATASPFRHTMPHGEAIALSGLVTP